MLNIKWHTEANIQNYSTAALHVFFSNDTNLFKSLILDTFNLSNYLLNRLHSRPSLSTPLCGSTGVRLFK